MKHILLLILLAMVLLQPINAQGIKVGLTVTPFGENDMLRLYSVQGAAGIYGDGFYIVGITCQFPLTARFDVETGLEYSKHTVEIHPNLPPGYDDTPYKSTFKFVSIPVTLKMNFLKYFFVNGGCLLDIDTHSSESSIDNQTGLGVILGVGVKYDFKFGGTLFANPYLKCHSLVHFLPDNHHEKLVESGIRFGVTYNLSR